MPVQCTDALVRGPRLLPGWSGAGAAVWLVAGAVYIAPLVRAKGPSRGTKATTQKSGGGRVGSSGRWPVGMVRNGAGNGDNEAARHRQLVGAHRLRVPD